MAVDLCEAREIADSILSSPPEYGVCDFAEADDFWAFFGGYADGIVRDENPQSDKANHQQCKEREDLRADG